MRNPFYRVKCECKNSQIIFSRCSTEIKCLVCDKVIAKPTGGLAHIDAKIIEKLDK